MPLVVFGLRKPREEMINMNCVKCYYNFDGICASHTIVKGLDLDTYGMPIKEIMELKPISCSDYKNTDKPNLDILNAMGLQFTLTE